MTPIERIRQVMDKRLARKTPNDLSSDSPPSASSLRTSSSSANSPSAGAPSASSLPTSSSSANSPSASSSSSPNPSSSQCIAASMRGGPYNTSAAPVSSA
ncbi:hypothetical protein BGZ58_004628, partial [Dissophora ornata]